MSNEERPRKCREDSTACASPDGFATMPSLRVIAMPKDTNNYGTVFGGVILSYLDQAGYVEARKHGNHRWVTVSVNEVIFHAPVQVGDTVSFYTRTERKGTTSVTVDVLVIAERFDCGECVEVTEATMTFVAVDEGGHPIPFAGHVDIA